MYPTVPSAQVIGASPVPSSFPTEAHLASRWRRLAAFAIDSILVGIAAQIIGWMLFTPLSRMGLWARLFGFCIALPYYAILNSRAGGGQTLGKRFLSIEVVDSTGKNISPERSFWRYCIFIFPIMLNGVYVQGWTRAFTMAVSEFASIIVLASFFLLMFNSATKQVLHDFVAATYVVEAGTRHVGVLTKPLKRSSLALAGGSVAMIFLAEVVLVMWVSSMSALRPLLNAAQIVGDMPHVRGANVSVKTRTSSSGESNIHAYVTVISDNSVGNEAEFANDIGADLVEKAPSIQNLGPGMTITITHGYNMGIASSWDSESYPYRF
jgi:uncharacterized RDD family membrane protein YckC